MTGDDERTDDESNVATIEYDWTTTGGPSLAVIEAVAATTGRETSDVPPLHEYVDGDALDALVTSASARSTDHMHVSFSYNGYRVVVDGSGAVRLPVESSDDEPTS